MPGSTNPRSSPYEFVFTGNNTGVSDTISIALAPSPDLRVTAISAPANGEEGSVIDLEWTVLNQGQGGLVPQARFVAAGWQALERQAQARQQLTVMHGLTKEVRRAHLQRTQLRVAVGRRRQNDHRRR